MINKNQIIASVCFAFLLFENFSDSNIHGRNINGSILAGGLKRTYLLHIPLTYDNTKSMPHKDPQDGTRIRKETYRNGEINTEVVLYIIEGGGHTWPGGYQYLNERIIGKTSRDMSAAEVIWNFFDKHSIL
jgi:poly(3-hydroxybutyrate) depolymerase